MELIQAIIAALSLFTASPEAHSFFEHAPQGTFQSIPLGSYCGPTESLGNVIAGFDPPETVIETVIVDDNTRLHLSRAAADMTAYTIFVEYVNQGITCAIEMQGEPSLAL